MGVQSTFRARSVPSLRGPLPGAFTLSFMVLLLPGVGAGGDSEAMLIAPKKIVPGCEATVTVRTFSLDGSPLSKEFAVKLGTSDGGDVIAEGKTDDGGWASVPIRIGRGTPAGARLLTAEVSGLDGPLSLGIEILEKPVLLLETDKPIYKPGQTIQGRAVLLDNALRPLGGDVQVQIREAKGNKVFQKNIAANDFGVAPFELPLASELNCGEWKIAATSGQASAQAVVRVEPYVLPRFKIEVQLDREWFLVDEKVTGTVRAGYFFGKPVDGDVVAAASVMEGDEWDEYARATSAMRDGSARFEVPPGWAPSPPYYGIADPSYPISIEFVVTDSSGHAEKVKQLVTIARSACRVRLVTPASSAKPGMPLDLGIEATDPGGRPVSMPLEVFVFGCGKWGETLTSDSFRHSRRQQRKGGTAGASCRLPCWWSVATRRLSLSG